MEEDPSTPERNGRARQVATPRSTATDDAPDGVPATMSMADLEEHSKTINEHFQNQIKELTSAINEHEIGKRNYSCRRVWA